ncbi:carotenoid oxygenase family protein [Anabaena subtropica]|uniref:Carotenoid oxygenase family protein n=1 Tax=Anabaena subtropica FACHB-260 TaxID=2692884 RepID=A0ABR8CJY8_9NOST|nr:carotenoid oxygenase family protein [Anabaena subtropica]MBD2342815.1 carotenoid oxygenase family protein [Anabaena subtropica FACHB-260]
MQTISQPTTQKAWANSLKPATEFPPTKLPVLSGQIPTGLRGTLYRNGPARLERDGVKMGHWFDGDGAVLAVHFNDTGATGVYRYVQTHGYQQEAAANRLLHSTYGMTAPGPFWKRWFKTMKNPANISVLALPDRVLALWEGNNPYALDPETLQTKGMDDLGGLHHGLPYSAHPKCDIKTGEIFNFGISPGPNATLHLYKSDRTGKIRQKASIKLKGSPVVHDFALAGQYLVFFIAPVRLNLLPMLLGLSSYSDALEWQPNLGTEILVFDRETLSVVGRGETEPWYQWHFGNSYVDASGALIIDVVRYADFQTNQYLKEVVTGQTHTHAHSTLWQVQLKPQGKVTSIQQLLNQHCEFPIVPPQQVQQISPTYLLMERPGIDISQEYFGAIAKFDPQTDTLTTANLGENRYPIEPIYAPNALNSHQGWVVTIVYDGNSHTSEVWIFDSDRLDEQPVCRLGLPSVVPLGFHGTWKPA